MKRISFNLYVKMECLRCGRNLEADLEENDGEYIMNVEPCKFCLNEAHRKGKEEKWSSEDLK